MSAGPGGPAPDDPERARSQRREERERSRASGPRRPRAAREAGAARNPGAARGVGAAWGQLTAHQKLAAIAALALLLSMLLPWYQETGNAIVNDKLTSIDNSKNAFQVYSFVEAAVFVVSIGVLFLLYGRGRRWAFHLPGGDGAAIIAAGLWVMFLVFYRQLDKPDGRHEGPINTSVGVEWGIFVAFLLGALLAYAGFRIRAAHTPEPPVDGVAAPETTAAAPSSPPAHDWLAEDETAVAPRPRPPRRDGEPLAGELSVDDPAEYRPPPRRS
jgi:hypothetical protein